MVRQAGGGRLRRWEWGTVVTKDDMGLKNSHGIQNIVDIVNVYVVISFLLAA
jgi:hypothetical protein